MGTYVQDAGSRYVVKDGNLKSARKWLSAYGYRTHRTGHGDGCTHLSDCGYDEMLAGEVPYRILENVAEFVMLFCEEGSYACHWCPEQDGWSLIWKDAMGVHVQWKDFENPFSGKVSDLEKAFWQNAGRGRKEP